MYYFTIYLKIHRYISIHSVLLYSYLFLFIFNFHLFSKNKQSIEYCYNFKSQYSVFINKLMYLCLRCCQYSVFINKLLYLCLRCYPYSPNDYIWLHYLLHKTYIKLIWFDLIYLTPLSAISWRQVLVVEEAGVPGENHQYYVFINKLLYLCLQCYQYSMFINKLLYLCLLCYQYYVFINKFLYLCLVLSVFCVY
jgi:hypothetical protein